MNFRNRLALNLQENTSNSLKSKNFPKVPNFISQMYETNFYIARRRKNIKYVVS